jgi:hypothetical protein
MLGREPAIIIIFQFLQRVFPKISKTQKEKEGIKCAARAKPFCNAIQSSPNKFDRAKITKSYFYCSLSLSYSLLFYFYGVYMFPLMHVSA